MRTLLARPVTADTFAPYGWLVDAQGREGRPINAGSSLRVDGVGELALTAGGGTPCIAVFRAQARDIAGPWQTLEAHRLGTQTFIPLGGARCVLLVALVAQGGALPDPATLAAFVLPGTCGVTLRAGTWHHGLLALDAGDWVVIERRAAAVDCAVAELPEPVLLAVE